MKKSLLIFVVMVLGIAFLINDVRSVFAQETDENEFILEEIVVTS